MVILMGVDETSTALKAPVTTGVVFFFCDSNKQGVMDNPK